MENLSVLSRRLDEFFEVRELDRDPSMGIFVPMVYDCIGVDWRQRFEPDFTQRFNGLMIRGAEHVSTVFCSVFPTVDVLEKFLSDSLDGDMLFLHHPIDIECGDPREGLGRGFLPINLEFLDGISRKKLSVYCCHAPLDTNRRIGTGVAMVIAFDAKIEDNFYPYGKGCAGITASIKQVSTSQLVDKVKQVFGIPYVDIAGKDVANITKIAIVPGAGYKVSYLQEAESKGVQAYITGEIFDRIEGEYGRKASAEVQKFAQKTSMSLIGVSHAASEYLVMRNQMIQWLEDSFNITGKLLPLKKWWR